MEAPNKIYVEVRHPFGNEFTEMLGFESRGNSDDIEYIRKDALLEWAKEQSTSCDGAVAMKRAYDKLIEKLNSL